MSQREIPQSVKTLAANYVVL